MANHFRGNSKHDSLITNGITSKSSEQLKCSREEKKVGIRTEDGIQP